jgi:uncharacterized protein
MALSLERGANVNAQDNDSATPLLLAIDRDMYEAAWLLLEHGADPNVTNNDGKTPLHLLCQGGNLVYHKDSILELMALSLERGANANVQDKDGATPLLLAIKRNMYGTA